jgi:voltage-gated potassium channel
MCNRGDILRIAYDASDVLHMRALRHIILTHRHIFSPLTVIVIAISLGTLGYQVIEEWSMVDALYMTVITMTTVGYGEVWPLSEAGRLFTIGLILTSIGIAGYVVSKITALVVEGEVKRLIEGRRMDKSIAKLSNHIILCGAGRTGLHIAEELARARIPFVVIEQDKEALEDVMRIEGLLYLEEDATQDETLLMAGIKRARGLITTLSEDKDNIFVTLCARSLNPELRIVARLIEDKNREFLRKAGADEIVSPNAIGGVRMASVLLRPVVVSFLDEMLRVTGQTLRMEEMHVDETPGLLDKSLGEVNIRRRTGLLVLAIKSQKQGYQFNPGADTILHSGDVLIVVGTEDQLSRLHAGE